VTLFCPCCRVVALQVPGGTARWNKFDHCSYICASCGEQWWVI
jgi:hypothetical protein